MPSKKQAPAVHLVLQGKGGVGKSLAASILAQFYLENRLPVKCFDTDPINQTFSSYKYLEAKHIDLLNESKIDERKFDDLMEQLLSVDSNFIVDNGASSFVPLSNYLLENNCVDILEGAGRQVYIHTVITGGQALKDTLFGFQKLAESTTKKNIVVWLNEFFGEIVANGKHFSEMAVCTSNEDKILGLVRIAKRNSDTFGKDVEVMISRKLTFSEALESADFSIMAKQRLKIIQREIFEQLAKISF